MAGGLARGASQKHWDPLRIFATVEAIATSNLVYSLGMGLTYQKQRLGPKLAGGLARGASQKNWDPLRIFATVEASNFKFGTQLGLGLAYQNDV